ncbi:hypothetical protein PLICRDRAFT_46110 [Plicaturopsis crispa FD-325 SS-3]|uniref:Unplaced genomic scaffold PLICRscaffold_18, whole genome shotgun sequence n=1 Tax=Plicaturopsis crispa FD-325 SS-3 TaxID=944288 RepID=A0A0C9T7Z5_PLICR|nr:hypothetical protein PLICRDRAFT_46110 [Plicaturopsis crispa FD-325 SS-3]
MSAAFYLLGRTVCTGEPCRVVGETHIEKCERTWAAPLVSGLRLSRLGPLSSLESSSALCTSGAVEARRCRMGEGSDELAEQVKYAK